MNNAPIVLLTVTTLKVITWPVMMMDMGFALVVAVMSMGMVLWRIGHPR